MPAARWELAKVNSAISKGLFGDGTEDLIASLDGLRRGEVAIGSNEAQNLLERLVEFADASQHVIDPELVMSPGVAWQTITWDVDHGFRFVQRKFTAWDEVFAVDSDKSIADPANVKVTPLNTSKFDADVWDSLIPLMVRNGLALLDYALSRYNKGTLSKWSKWYWTVNRLVKDWERQTSYSGAQLAGTIAALSKNAPWETANLPAAGYRSGCVEYL